MNMDYLHGDELEYELSIRGYPAEGTVAEKRKRLRPALRMEKEGVVFSHSLQLDLEEETEICAKKVDELKAATDSFNFENASNEYKRYRARLGHVMGRISRINFPENDSRKGQLLVKCGEISDYLEETILLLDPIRVPEFPSVVPPGTGNTSVENTTAVHNSVSSPNSNPNHSNQSRNASLMDVEPRDLEIAISNLQMGSSVASTLTSTTQTRATSSVPGSGVPASATHAEMFAHRAPITTTSSNFAERQSQYLIAHQQPSIPYLPPGRHPNTVLQGQHPTTAFQSQPTWGSYFPGQAVQQYSHLPPLNDPLAGCGNPSVPMGDPSRKVGFLGPVHGAGQGLDAQTGAGVDHRDRLRVFKTVSQWNLKFDGLAGVNDFLEGVEELRSACGITKEQLMGASIVLFKGVALDWFRANVPQSGSWDNLVTRLRLAFLPSGYEEDVWADIRTRTQGQLERSITYISVMQNLFNKLAEKPSEQTRVRVITRNLLPYLQSQLALSDFASVSELTTTCQRVEEAQARIQCFKPPPTNPLLVSERESMYDPRKYRQRVNTIETLPNSSPQSRVLEQARPSYSEQARPSHTEQASSTTANLICWNCRQRGHVKRDCRQPRTKHCFGCGRPDTVKSNCPRCSGNSTVTH